MTTIPGMGRKPLNREPMNITLPKELKKLAAKAARSEGRTTSDLITELLRDYLRKNGYIKNGMV